MRIKELAPDFTFPLLSDPQGTAAQQYGVRRTFGPAKTRRRTFVIDTDRRILTVISNELSMNKYADEALKVLQDQSSAA